MKENRQCIEDVEESAQKTEDAKTVERFCSDVAEDILPDNPCNGLCETCTNYCHY